MPDPIREQRIINALSVLTLSPNRAEDALRTLGTVTAENWQELLSLADSHHVTVRALVALKTVAGAELAGRIDAALAKEHARIAHALPRLQQVCRTLEANDCATVVMKSLDHWPDIGNDLDLFTTAPERDVVRVFEHELHADAEPRSWGDRLAKKWNFKVSDLPESVEVHCERAGQTGEHIAIARRIVSRRVSRTLSDCTFNVPAPEERVIIGVLQRMYRHFYFRVCDIVNTAELVDSEAIDYAELKRASQMGGIWPGVATFLNIASGYVQQYRGTLLPLPDLVTSSARFGSEKLTLKRRFLRIPIMPEGVDLYRQEVTAAAKRGDVPATLRLSLLPPLASAAAVAYKFTGSDKGIW